MNQVTLLGRLTKDFKAMKSGETKIVLGTLAINRPFAKDGQQQADFINIKAFNKTAETLVKFVKKGQRILINGTIQTGSYEKDGKTVYTTDVLVNGFEFIETKEKEKIPF